MSEAGKSVEDQVRERAYALWEQDGRPDGRSDEYWEQARQEVDTVEGEPEPGQPTAAPVPPKTA